jgi:hypothetical protein
MSLQNIKYKEKRLIYIISLFSIVQKDKREFEENEFYPITLIPGLNLEVM